MLHRFFYASSACIYPEGKQLDTKVEGGGLKEQDAWPAQACSPRRLSDLPYLRQLLFGFLHIKVHTRWKVACLLLPDQVPVLAPSQLLRLLILLLAFYVEAEMTRGLCLQPQDAYGLEKLASEELAMHYDKDFALECRIARFHNIYGPYGTWKGGREKAPAAFCRKASLVTCVFFCAVLHLFVLVCI